MAFIIRKTLTETYLERIQTTPAVVGFQFKPTHSEMGTVGEWKQVTFREFNQECRLVSFGLMGLGLKPQDKVVILSNTRYEWALSDMAILGAAAITVPIYASNTADDVAYIVNHSEARVAFLEDAKQLEKILEKRDSLKHLEKIVLFEPSAMRMVPGRQDVMTLQALKELGRREEAKEPGRFEKNLTSAKPDDLITICYTSGTTGTPKGVMLSHDNMISVLDDCVQILSKHVRPESEIMVAFLPFSHIIGKAESMGTYVFGWRECYAENLDKLLTNIAEIRPTLMFAVPRIFEKAHNRIEAMVAQGSNIKKAMFEEAFQAGRDYYSAIWEKRTPGIRDTIKYKLAQKAVLDKIAQRFGGRLRFAVCGGAPLPKEIGEYFQIAGIKILEGYGLTETAAPVALMTPENIRFGTVGRPLPEVTIKIAEDGEILVKSRKVFKGYFKMPEESAAALEGGWFHTGDIGFIDDDGFLHITDRKKDLIITSGGKNIAPQKIENLAKTMKYINQFVVHGDRRNYLTALITLDKEAIIQYANDNQILFSEYAELTKNAKIQSLIQRVVDELNSKLPSFETIKKFIILPAEFTVESGEITPSLKIKRNLVNQKYKQELDSMYAS